MTGRAGEDWTSAAFILSLLSDRSGTCFSSVYADRMARKAGFGSSIRGRAAAVALACVLPSSSLLYLGAGVDSGRADPTAGAAAHPGVERAIRGCANRNRHAAGLEPLQPSRVLSKAARLHARNMALEGFFDHTDPKGRGPTERVEIFDRKGKFFFVGENIAASYESARSACEGWMHSAGHRANILREGFTNIGAGFSRGGPYDRYYVQVFARRQGPELDS